MKLSYRTHDDSPSLRKAKVYFIAHPDDYDRYLSLISDEVLNHFNCAFFYDEEPLAPYDPEGLSSVLSDMNLIIIPVTSRFLHSGNRALDVEFRFAVENHIPVLPLLEERNIAEEFDRICGNLHTLSRYNDDDTTMPYAEKLAGFLRTNLIGDELADKIRAAFDTYVFLSYRKKDRREAQELMRLIHKNPVCRDIAIWYDEYLVPGEDFNTGIEDALMKSSMFLLAVTPHLLETGNYVMTEEFPRASANNKLIIPAELVQTDRKPLEELYPGIPPYAGKDRISEEIARVLRTIAFTGKNNSPDHNYFIGLAYLNGIDVEINRELAVQLITGAAESELPEAISKLTEMYSNGIGVRRDVKTAIDWQEKLVSLYRREYMNNDADNDSAKKLFYPLLVLGDYCLEANDLPRARAAFEEMRIIAEKLDINAYHYEIPDSLDKLGDVSRAEGSLKKAREYYKEALAIREAKQAERGGRLGLFYIAISYRNIGDISLKDHDLQEAFTYYRKACEISERMANGTGFQDAGFELAKSCTGLGKIHHITGDLSSARKHYEKAIKIYETQITQFDTYNLNRDLAVLYSRLGELYMELDDPEEARICSDKAAAVIRKLESAEKKP